MTVLHNAPVGGFDWLKASVSYTPVGPYQANPVVHAWAVGHPIAWRLWAFECHGTTPDPLDFRHLIGPLYWKRT